MEPLISVIIPVYNVEKYIYKCVESIKNQTYKNLEIILVDDGSPDNCPQICDELSKSDSRIKVIHKKNGGLSDARNTGIKKSSGEYIFFADSDDYVEITIIEKLYNALKASQADMSICGYRLVDESGNELSKHNKFESREFTKSEVLQAMADRTYNWILGVAWNKLYKRSLFNNISYPKGKLHEDDYVSHELYNLCEKVCVINENLYNYVQRNGSIINSAWNVHHADGAEALLNRIDFAYKYNYIFLIPLSERYAFYIIRKTKKNINKKNINDMEYFNNIFKRYIETYKKCKKICNLSFIEKMKRMCFIIFGV